MGRPIKTAKTAATDIGYSNVPGYGIVGGNTGITGTQIKCRVKIGTNAEADGWIVRQKGARKYFVTDGTNFGTCALVDKTDGALLAGDMTITITKLDASTAKLSKFGDSFGSDFAGNSYYLTFGAAAAIPVGGIYEVAQVASL